MPVEEHLRAAARARFAQLAQGADADLALDEAAAWLAAEDQPGTEAALTLAALDELAAGLSVPPQADVFQQMARLVHHLFSHHGMTGDEEDYGNPHNSYLDRVLERRRGLPILLSVVVMEVGRRVGVDIDGIGFPGHFLVRPRKAEPPFFLDPFHGGRIVRLDELQVRLQGMGGGTVGAAQAGAWLAPVSARQILLRMNHNLKNSFLERRDLHGVLRAVERLLLLDPGQWAERRDRALILGQLGRRRAAITELNAYLEAFPLGPEADRLREHLARLQEDHENEG